MEDSVRMKICEVVDTVMKSFDDWANQMDLALADAGFDPVWGALDGSDPCEIAVIDYDDGEKYVVYLSDESQQGPYKYEVVVWEK